MADEIRINGEAAMTEARAWTAEYLSALEAILPAIEALARLDPTAGKVRNAIVEAIGTGSAVGSVAALARVLADRESGR